MGFEPAERISELEPELSRPCFLVLDLRRVRSLDFTAGRLLNQIQTQLADAGGELALANLAPELRPYLDHFDVLEPKGPAHVFDGAHEALEWAEERILLEAAFTLPPALPPLSLERIDMIMIPDRCEATEAEVITVGGGANGIWPSDHFPVRAIVNLKPTNE